MTVERRLKYVIFPVSRGEKTLVKITPETPQVSLKAVLEDFYWGQEMNMREIGALINRCPITIGRYFKELEIEVRSPQESHRLSWRNPKKRQVYVETMEQNWQRNPERRERQREIARELFNRPEIRAKTRKTRQEKAHTKMERVLGVTPKKTLKELIQKERLNNKQIAQKLNVSVYQVEVWKKSFGIELGGISHPKINQVNKDLFRKAKEAGFLKKLTLNQRSVLEKRYGKRPVSLSEIAKSRGVTRETISQTEQRAFKKLRELLAS